MRILTFDIEDWFHLLDHPSTNNYNNWHEFESRIHRNMDLILDLLIENDIKATFFCLGWIAEKYPEIIRSIISQGHEIGSHSYYHQLVYKNNKNHFRKELISSIRILEDISGKSIKSYRAPGFSIKDDNLWALDILIENGIEYDSSIFPAHRAHGGVKNLKVDTPFKVNFNGVHLKEFPLNTVKILNSRIVFSGGGYFRLFPYSLIKSFTKSSDYVMTYFHPRDFDPNQPVISDLSPIRKFKSYYGLRNSEDKFRNWISDFNFIDIAAADKLIDWGQVPILEYADFEKL